MQWLPSVCQVLTDDIGSKPKSFQYLSLCSPYHRVYHSIAMCYWYVSRNKLQSVTKVLWSWRNLQVLHREESRWHHFGWERLEMVWSGYQIPALTYICISFIAPRAHVYSRVKRLLCQCVSQSNNFKQSVLTFDWAVHNYDCAVWQASSGYYLNIAPGHEVREHNQNQRGNICMTNLVRTVWLSLASLQWFTGHLIWKLSLFTARWW